jgi:hypothetical protein
MEKRYDRPILFGVGHDCLASDWRTSFNKGWSTFLCMNYRSIVANSQYGVTGADALTVG